MGAHLPPEPTSVALAQLAAVQRARNEWREWPAVADSGKGPRADRILRYLAEGVGDHRASVAGYQWCGAWVAWCYAGLLHPEIRMHLFPSTYRLGVYARQATDLGIGWPYRRVRTAAGDVRLLSELREDRGGGPLAMRGADLASVRPGDIVLVGPGAWGSHVTIAVAVHPSGGIETLSGNTSGQGADGKRRAVGSVVYLPDQIRAAVRPCLADLDLSLVYLP